MVTVHPFPHPSAQPGTKGQVHIGPSLFCQNGAGPGFCFKEPEGHLLPLPSWAFFLPSHLWSSTLGLLCLKMGTKGKTAATVQHEECDVKGGAEIRKQPRWG